MRLSLLLSALCAAAALGAHNHKRKVVYVTDWTMATVTTTVNAGQEAATTTTHQPPKPTVKPKSPHKLPQDIQGNENVVVWTTYWTGGKTKAAHRNGGHKHGVHTMDAQRKVAPTTLQTTTAPPPAAPTNTYHQNVLYNHNVHRSNHSAPALSWSRDLEASAHKLAAQCVYRHDTSIDGGGYGQNIGYGVEAKDVGVMITNLMYNDEFGYFEPYFGAADPSMSTFDSWGHFTQIVWKSTKQVGCATVVCNGLGNVDSSSPIPFTVCNYGPPGNMAGEYAKNVGVPKGEPIFSG